MERQTLLGVVWDRQTATREADPKTAVRGESVAPRRDVRRSGETFVRGESNLGKRSTENRDESAMPLGPRPTPVTKTRGESSHSPTETRTRGENSS